MCRPDFAFSAVIGDVPWRPLLLAPLLVLSWGAHALDGGVTKDPTVPPAVWLAAQPQAPGTALQHAEGDAASVRVMLVGRSRRFALIDGQVVKAGDIHNGSKVVAIRPGEVVVEDASKSLKMAPGVEKKMIKRAMPKKPARTAPGSKSTANRNETGNGSSQ